MDTISLVAVVLIIVFLVLALVAIVRYDKVSNTINVLGMKIHIAGSRGSATGRSRREASSKRSGTNNTGDANIHIGGKVSDSVISAESTGKSEVDIEKDVEKSKIRSKGG